MRMDPKHQFAAQYVLSRAAAERRERENMLAAAVAVGGNMNMPMNQLPGTLPPVQQPVSSPSSQSEASTSSISQQEMGQQRLGSPSGKHHFI